MRRDGQPVVLIIDDEPDSLSLLEASGVHFAVRHPMEVTLPDITGADVIAVDYHVEWKVDAPHPCSTPVNGLALASTVRQAAIRESGHSPAVVILTGRIGELADKLEPGHRNHVVARQRDLEWVFEKGSNVSAQLASLAKAVCIVRIAPSYEDAIEHAAEVMGVNRLDARLQDCIIDDIRKCRPPTRVLLDWSTTQAPALIRWLLYRIIPYPTCLWNDQFLASRLRIKFDDLAAALDGTDLGALLGVAQYHGVLHDFAGRRWWRAGIESILWRETDGRSFTPVAVQELVSARASDTLQYLIMPFPVVCVDDHLAPEGDTCDIDDTVRIEPDDWPSFAADARITIAKAEEDTALARMVASEDLERLPS